MALPAALLLGLQATMVPSAGIFDVTKYGAKGDAKTVDSSAVRAAAAACASAGGGTLLFPAAPLQGPPCADPYAGMLRGYVTGAFGHGP